MKKLFGAIIGAQPAAQQTIGHERYTRSPNAHKPRSAAAIDEDHRHAVQPVAEKRVPGAARQRVFSNASQNAPRVDETVHLHADTSIPVSILRKALPLRFARMNKDVDEFIFS